MKKLKNIIIKIVKKTSLMVTLILSARFLLILINLNVQNYFLDLFYKISAWLLLPLPDFLKPIELNNSITVETKTLAAIIVYIAGSFVIIIFTHFIFKNFTPRKNKGNKESLKTEGKTVMFTDIKGYTQKSSQISRSQLRKFLRRHQKILEPIFDEFQGTVIKTIGDSYLVIFNSPTNAVLCGVKIQKKLKSHNRFSLKNKLEVKIAINCGEVTIINNDVFGDAINITARVENIAKAGEIYLTESACFLINKNEVKIEEVGNFNFKGIKDQIKVFRVLKP
ncbi:MAG: hypothetical protein GF335_04430 [Candidatus Moranbacteria bacterium]|nr:hypothetical protein [Candidatus Moranbacteria bacterium]